MLINSSDRLATLISQETENLLTQWRNHVRELPSARRLETPALNDHIPELLEEVVAALRIQSPTISKEALIDGTPPAHGLQRLKDGFDIEAVVAEYNLLRGCIHQLAAQNEFSIKEDWFPTVNKVLDHATGLAVHSFAFKQALDLKHKREEYLAFVAHDLRTPLSAIFMATRVLQSLPHPEDPSQKAKMLNTLSRNIQRLDSLVSKVLDENISVQSEIGISVERRSFDLWPLVESLSHDLHPVAEAESTHIKNAVPDDLVVFGDAYLIRRVFQNLISNAINHAPQGVVVINARYTDAEGVVECSVSDNGKGIPHDRIEKIFDKFESDRQDKGSVGLGLAIVKSFVEAHGGTVTVTSAEGVGTEFRFTIPETAKKISSPM